MSGSNQDVQSPARSNQNSSLRFELSTSDGSPLDLQTEVQEPKPDPHQKLPRPSPLPETSKTEPSPDSPKPEPRPDTPRPSTPKPDVPRPDTPVPWQYLQAPATWRESSFPSSRQPPTQSAPRFPSPWNPASDPPRPHQRPRALSETDISRPHPPIGAGRPTRALRRKASTISRSRNTLLAPTNTSFTTMPPEMNVQGRPKYPPGTCHPWYVERRTPLPQPMVFDHSRYHGEKREVKPFDWTQYRVNIDAGMSVEDAVKLNRMRSLYHAVAINGPMEDGNDEEPEMILRRGQNEGLWTETREQTKRRCRNERRAAMLRMAMTLGENLGGTRAVLAHVVLRRRIAQRILPYPVDRLWALRYLTTENHKAEILKVSGRMRKGKAEEDPKRKRSKIERRGVVARYSVNSERLGDISIAVQPPVAQNTAIDDTPSTSIQSSAENLRKLPIDTTDIRRTSSEPPITRVPLVNVSTEDIRIQKATATTKAEEAKLRTEENDCDSDNSSSSSSSGSLERPLSVNNSDEELVPVPTVAQEEKGKLKMTLQEERTYRIIERQRMIKEIKERIQMLENIQLLVPKSGFGGVVAKINELETLLDNLGGLDHDISGESVFESLHRPSKRAKALMMHGGSIIRSNIGPSSADYRKQLSLEIFGTEIIPPMPSYEFDSPDTSEIGDDETEALEVPSMITVTDYDQGHEGIEIMVLPEPTEQHTRPEASVVFYRGGDPVQLFGRLVAEYHETITMSLSNRKIRRLWDARGRKIAIVLQHLRHRIPDHRLDEPGVGAFLGERAALEMLQSTIEGHQRALVLAEEANQRRGIAQGVLYQLSDHSARLHKLNEEAYRRRLDMCLTYNIDPTTDIEVQLRGREIEEHRKLIAEVRDYTETDIYNGLEVMRLEDIIQLLRKHSSPIKHDFEDFEPGRNPFHYAPDCPHDYNIPVRNKALIDKTKACLPLKIPEKRFIRPANTLRDEVVLDALMVLGALEKVDRNKVRQTMLLAGPYHDIERPRLPEENWEPNVSYDFPDPGRVLLSNNYGIFSWRIPRKRLAILKPLAMPPLTQAFQGHAQMNFRVRREVYERWGFGGWKKIEVRFLGSVAADLLAAEDPPPDSPPDSPTGTAISITRKGSVKKRGSDDDTDPPSSGSSPGGTGGSWDEDDDDGFVEDIKDPGSIKPSGGTVMVRQRNDCETKSQSKTLSLEMVGRTVATGRQSPFEVEDVGFQKTSAKGDLSVKVEPIDRIPTPQLSGLDHIQDDEERDSQWEEVPKRLRMTNPDEKASSPPAMGQVCTIKSVGLPVRSSQMGFPKGPRYIGTGLLATSASEVQQRVSKYFGQPPLPGVSTKMAANNKGSESDNKLYSSLRLLTMRVDEDVE